MHMTLFSPPSPFPHQFYLSYTKLVFVTCVNPFLQHPSDFSACHPALYPANPQLCVQKESPVLSSNLQSYLPSGGFHQTVPFEVVYLNTRRTMTRVWLVLFPEKGGPAHFICITIMTTVNTSVALTMQGLCFSALHIQTHWIHISVLWRWGTWGPEGLSNLS